MHVKYKYFYDPHPEKCPICGNHWDWCSCDTFYEQVNPSKIYGAHLIGYKYVWYLPPNDLEYLDAKICTRCGQPVFFDRYRPFDTDYFFIYIVQWVAWVGSTHYYCISVNKSSGEATITALMNYHHITIVLDKDDTSWLIAHKQALKSYNSPKNGYLSMDESIYQIRFIDNYTCNNFEEIECGRTPLENKIFDFIHKFGTWPGDFF